ncbi:MAG: hypothetical protein D6694_00240 [Gammaproteobacteria bacterium]|nr:MAG: hypothetical protein D6694_00240 [Gammaproteobacteria bacterium]
MSWVADEAKMRQEEIEKALRDAFADFLETREVEVIIFSNVSVPDLAKAIMRHPSILKPLIAVCNIAARAIERDLRIRSVNTYNPKLTEQKACAIAGYIKPFLPPYIEIPALSTLDRVAFIDKEIRKGKGRWERRIVETLNRFSSVKFKKRKFTANGEEFELDAATPHDGPVQIGIDVKRIEARRDIHKRCDEIVNKAARLKSVFPEAQFATIIYYPFIDEHINIQNRLSSGDIDVISFASESKDSIENAVRMLLARLGVAR